MKCCVLVLVSKRCPPKKICTQSADLLVSASVAQSASVMIVISSTQSCCSKIQTTCGCVWMNLARCFIRASANTVGLVTYCLTRPVASCVSGRSNAW